MVRGADGAKPKSGAAVHRASATLAADGTRTHRYDGRAVSGKDLRGELRALGIALDSASTVFKQAAVTRLADANSPAALAGVVGEASGASGSQPLHPTAACAAQLCRNSHPAPCRKPASPGVWMQRKAQAEAEQVAAEDDARRLEEQRAVIVRREGG